MYRSLLLVLAAPLSFPFLARAAADAWQHPPGYDATIRSSQNDHQSAIGVDQDGPRQVERSKVLRSMLSAVETMQDTYFSVFGGTWPDAIDWTAAVMGTHISATLSSLVLGLEHGGNTDNKRRASCTDQLGWENVVNKYFTQTALFYFGENAFALRNQAYDDMLWVVLGWLENVKFAEMYSTKYWEDDAGRGAKWHGLQMTASAAHRARIFYELASKGWETKLCGGGMVWNPRLEPYKNAITNELFAAASISMYLYFPGDNITSPFITEEGGHPRRSTRPHDPLHLDMAVTSYKWLKTSGMQSSVGLYQDGFHISGWTRYRNGTIDPGTGKCDSLNTMVYTYNQGVMLSASRGLWLATGARSYLDDGHYLIQSVIKATGWPNRSKDWSGLGRAGVLEEFCDRGGYCSQDGQTFKGIFFHHLVEFCRPLWPQEEEYVTYHAATTRTKFDKIVYRAHLTKCASYGKWIEHNAKAALRTKDKHGLFGMWWGIPSHSSGEMLEDVGLQDLPRGAVDHLNHKDMSSSEFTLQDLNQRGRGRTVETQSGGLGVVRAHWQWQSLF